MTEKAMVMVEHDNRLAFRDMVGTAFTYAQAATSKNTRRTYAAGWYSFVTWCEGHGANYKESPEKEGLVALYASSMASSGRLKASSLGCYMAAICFGYKDLGVVINLKHPAISTVLKGIRNTLPKRPARKEPILTEDLQSMMKAIPVDHDESRSIIGIRDRALILLGFSGAFRRSEITALTMDDIAFTRDGIIALVRRSKTDQEGEGLEKVIPYGANPITCPVRALKDWIEASGISEGPVFRAINRHGRVANNPLAGNAVSRIIKRNPCIKAKEDKYGGHSLRAGFVTSAVQRGVPEDLIMAQTGHKSSNTLKIYIRRGKSFSETAAAMVGL